MPGPSNNAFIYLVSQLEASCMQGKNWPLAEGAARLIYCMVTASQKLLQKQQDYITRQEVGAFLCTTDPVKKPFSGRGYLPEYSKVYYI